MIRDFSKIKMYTILKFLFWLTIIFAIVGSAFFVFPIASYHLFPFRVLLLLILFLIILQILSNQGKLIIFFKKIEFYLLFLIFWFLYTILSLGWVSSKILALRQISFLFIGLALIFLLVLYLKKIKDFRNFYWLWIIMLAALLGIGFWEILTGNHLSVSAYLGRTTAYAGKFKPSGFFDNTNDLATFLGLTFPFVLTWLRYKKRLKNKIFGLMLLGASFYLLLAAGSRANFLALILEVFVLFFFLFSLSKKIKWLISAGLIILCLFLLFPGFSQQIYYQTGAQLKSFTSTYQRTVGSDAMRVNLTKNAIYYLVHSYGFGVGAGNIEWHIANYSPYYTSTLLNLHNWWMEILANYGIFIFFEYLLFYFALIYNLWKIWHKKLSNTERIICETLLLSLIGFSIASVSSSSIMSFKPQWIIFGVSLAFLNYYRISYPKVITIKSL